MISQHELEEGISGTLGATRCDREILSAIFLSTYYLFHKENEEDRNIQAQSEEWLNSMQGLACLEITEREWRHKKTRNEAISEAIELFDYYFKGSKPDKGDFSFSHLAIGRKLKKSAT